MTLVRLTPPAVLPVTLAEAKLHFRVDFEEDDAAIEFYLRAATEHLDGRDGLLGRCLITQVWRLTLDRFTPSIVLPLPPCQSVEEVAYVDDIGNARTFTALHVEGLGGVDGARLSPVSPWPDGGPVTITFTAGYGDSPEDVPAPIRQAILTRACQLYDTRDAIIDMSDDFTRDHRAWVF